VDSPQLKQIRVAPVEAAEVSADEVTAPARVVVNPNRSSKVLLPVPGRVVAVMARLGDAVEQGQPVVALESADADAAIAAVLQAAASERQAQAALTKARADVQRTRELHEAKAVAQKDVLSAENDLAQAMAALDTARAAHEQASRRLALLGLKPSDFHQRILVKAPIAGKVLEVGVAPGEYRTDTATPLMTVADLSVVWVSADVPESAIRLIRVGERVALSFVAYPGELFSGRVARIADVLDKETRTVKVHVEMPNPQGRFRPEMFASVRHAGTSRTLPVVPVVSVVQEYGRAVVFVERDPGRYQRREVTLGSRVADRIAVVTGVTAGERVVVDGAVLLKDR
jgi:cobalt-zinc-cadmium efflux system membrane fusion protein